MSRLPAAEAKSLAVEVEKLALLANCQAAKHILAGDRAVGPAIEVDLRPLAEIEREILILRLKHFYNSKPHVAVSLGISVKSVYSKIKAYGIPLR